MMGRTAATARPTIMFYSNDLNQNHDAKRVREAVKSSKILDTYLGFRPGRSSRPLEYQDIFPLEPHEQDDASINTSHSLAEVAISPKSPNAEDQVLLDGTTDFGQGDSAAISFNGGYEEQVKVIPAEVPQTEHGSDFTSDPGLERLQESFSS